MNKWLCRNSNMLVDFTRVKNFFVCGRTVMSREMGRIAYLFQYEYNMGLRYDTIFLFCGGKSDYLNVVHFLDNKNIYIMH